MLLNCGVGEDSWETFQLQGVPTCPSWRKSILNIHWKNWCWSWNSNTLATWYEVLTYFKKRPWSLLSLLAKIKCEKDPDSGRDWRWEEKGMTEDEVVRWHHQFNGHEFEVTPGVGDGQRGLACFSPCDRKELHVIEQLNWIELMQLPYKCFLWFHYWPSINQFIHSSPVS